MVFRVSFVTVWWCKEGGVGKTSGKDVAGVCAGFEGRKTRGCRGVVRRPQVVVGWGFWTWEDVKELLAAAVLLARAILGFG